MPAAADRPRLSGPGELVAALPLLTGFVPRESLVVVCLEGSGPRVGLTARYDLPPPEDEAELVADVAVRLRQSGTSRAWVVVVTEQEAAGGLPRRGLVDGLHDLPVDLLDVLLARGGRWWSYLCHGGSCCPPGGTPVPAASPALTLVRAEAAAQGRAVLPDREALVASLAGPPGDEGRAGLDAAGRELADEVAADGQAAVRRRLLRAAERALTAPAEADAARLALSLHDVRVRDEVLTWSVRRGEALLALLLRLARATPAPDDAPVCACLAWVAWSRGDGATASVALDRALGSDPGHRLALLLRRAVDQQVRPAALRSVAVRAAVDLRGGRRG